LKTRVGLSRLISAGCSSKATGSRVSSISITASD
jgi:hypothetical protein